MKRAARGDPARMQAVTRAALTGHPLGLACRGRLGWVRRQVPTTEELLRHGALLDCRLRPSIREVVTPITVKIGQRFPQNSLGRIFSVADGLASKSADARQGEDTPSTHPGGWFSRKTWSPVNFFQRMGKDMGPNFAGDAPQRSKSRIRLLGSASNGARGLFGSLNGAYFIRDGNFGRWRACRRAVERVRSSFGSV